jgi:ribosomal protein S27E
MVARTYYRTDESNSPWTINLLMKIGGGNPRTGKLEGIHWHMLTANTVEYIATDEKRQEISWVRVTRENGDVVVYSRDEADGEINPEDPALEVRRFDCMDCHNRPSHTFLPPATALNLALSAKRISPELPYIRQVGLDLLNEVYEDSEQASAALGTGLQDYYRENYPDILSSKAQVIETAATALQTIYSENFFPEMKTDYRARENNLSHFVNDGCFRCHNESLITEDGSHLSYDCQTCHTIVAQGPSELVSDLEMNLAGLDFTHPEDIGGMWQEVKCTECHTPESGY